MEQGNQYTTVSDAEQILFHVVIYNNWVNWEPGCCDWNPCKTCFKTRSGYCYRSSYLTEFVEKYLQNEPEILSGQKQMPDFLWRTPDDIDVKPQSLKKFHDKHCFIKFLEDKSFNDCNCVIKRFMREVWGKSRIDSDYQDPEAPFAKSVEQIMGRFVNICKQQVKKNK